MNITLLFTILSILTFTPLAVIACPPNKDPDSPQYTRRENNRCEGLKDRPASSITGLVSFATGLTSLSGYPDILNISVPSKNRVRPSIEVQSYARNYRLDELEIIPALKGFTFSLNTHILKTVDVPAWSLLAIAYSLQDSQRVYFPVILGKATGEYVFVINSDQRVSLPVFEIRQNNRTIYQQPQKIPDTSHRLTWNYSKASPGTYELHLVDNLGKSYTYYFEHNPKLL